MNHTNAIHSRLAVSNRHAAAAFASAALCVLAGCTNDFDPQSRVTDLRVVAVSADLPYARPGEEVQLGALVVDPEPRDVQWGYATCVNPADTDATGCLTDLSDRARRGETVSVARIDDPAQFSTEIPDDALDAVAPEFRGRASVGVALIGCPGVLADGLVPADDDDPLPFVCRDASGRRLGPFDVSSGVKRLFVRTEDRNANPVIDSLSWEGSPWPADSIPEVVACPKNTNHSDDCAKEFRHRIDVRPDASSFEVGTDETGVHFEEQLVVQFYATEGTFRDDVRVATAPDTEWVARAASRGQTVQLWFVLRDNRGGVTWESRSVRVRE